MRKGWETIMPTITEWTFTADIAKWIEQVLHERPDLPFSCAEVEERGAGSRKRRDLTLYDRQNKPAVTGEVKMPDSPDGRSPFQEALVMDAHQKANLIGVEYFFTWNVNRCVLWKTFEAGKPITERYLEHFPVMPAPVRHADELEHPRVQQQIKQFLVRFLERCAAIITGEQPMLLLPLDEKFLYVWEAALEQPVAQTLRAISDFYEKDKTFARHLDKWMRDEQGWTLSSDDEVLRHNLERCAKFSSYVLASKIIFYKALRRRFRRMRELIVPPRVTTGASLRDLFNEYFEHAIEVSRDYETVFKGDFGDSLPFLNDAAVDSWRDLSQQTDGFDFTQINYEIVGQIFERMLSTEERHKFGQHYTRSEVVDLINAFCIRDANAKVLDPACGGGTFLVRAYARKRDLSDGAERHGVRSLHQDLIQQLYGIDISTYPVHLTTINLVTRDLIDEANYPLVVRNDFFKVNVGDALFFVPFGGEGQQMVTQEIGKVDAVVGNPPYVRQEKINEYYGATYKRFLRELAQKESPAVELSGRSDIHCYFFPHALTFLKEGGYVGLLTSSTWLDTGYGFRLQEFLLNNFEIVAVFESNCEPWFTGARVTTAAVILRHQPNPDKRAANNVKFVWLTKPLSDLLTYAHAEEDRRLTFEELRNRVEAMTGAEEFVISPSDGEPVTVRQETLDGLRARIINQSDLYRLGCLPFMVSEDDESDEEDEEDPVKAANGEWNDEMESACNSAPSCAEETEYVGYKWGIFLRAPDILFKLLRRGGDRFVPLGQIADIKRGITSGCDRFFFPRDITGEALKKVDDEEEFKNRYGIYPDDTDRVRIVRAGDGSTHLIEKEYLEPVVFNLMEIDSVEIDPDKLQKQILLISKPRAQLRRTHVLRYLHWGEEEGFQHRPTCASRERWYDLGSPRRSDIVWSKKQRYRHIVAFNGGRFPCNCNLYDVWGLEGVDSKLLCAVLNSTLVALNKHSFGRIMGGDPVLSVEVVDMNMMLVPDVRRATKRVRQRLENALDSLRKRQTGHLVAVDSRDEGLTGELAMKDRQELDDAVLELLGVRRSAEREALRAELYAEMTKLYRSIRETERKMQKFRVAAARRGRPTPHSIADEIWDNLETKPQTKTPLDFAPLEDAETIDLPAGKAQVVDDLLHPRSLFVGGRYISLKRIARARFAKALSDCGIIGSVRIPNDSEVCEVAFQQYEEHVQQFTDEFTRLAAAYTADEAMQQRVVRELWRKVCQPAEQS